MEAAKTAVPKTPPESDPRKKSQPTPTTNEISPGPEEFEDIHPKDDGSAPTINKETPGLAGN